MPRNTMKEYTEAAKQFYKSQAWTKCREAYIKSVGGLCERCLAKGLIVPGYIVHHKCYLNSDNITDPSITLNFDNLEFVCQSCHNAIHFKEEHKKRYTIEKDGTVKAIG